MSKTASEWTTTLDNGETINTRVAFYGETVFVTVTLPDGTEVERRGRMTVHRGMKLGGTFGNSLTHPIVDVEVTSILGDVRANARSMIRAAEFYGSNVAQEVVRQWRSSPSGAHHRGEHDFNESQFSDTCPVCKGAVGQEV